MAAKKKAVTTAKENKFEGTEKVKKSVTVQTDDNEDVVGQFAHCCGVGVIGGFGKTLISVQDNEYDDSLQERSEDGKDVTLAEVVESVHEKFLVATTREYQTLAAEELEYRGFKAVAVYKGTTAMSGTKVAYSLTFWVKTKATK